MDFGHFDGFWRWLAVSRLNAQADMPVETILARVLGKWRTCVVCNLVWQRAFDLASRWQYVLAEDPEGRARFVESQTWCNRHAWFFKEVASPRTRGRLHRELCARLEVRIRKLLKGDLATMAGQSATRILWDLIGDRTCPLCDDEAAFQRVVFEELARGLASGSLRSAYEASAGCCLPHLAALLDTVSDADTARFLLKATLDQFARLVEELDIYEVETELHTRQYGAAADAPSRALVCWAGMRGMVQESPYRDQVSALHGGMD
jgi:hypothetical protein